MREITLQPGELSLTRQPAVISTILGSCVSFTMCHSDLGLAAMCHCLLPTRPHGKPNNPENRYAYLDATLAEMLSFFVYSGIEPFELKVKLFGGSDVIEALSGPKSVGRENLQTSRRLIELHRLRLVASDTGGPVGRKIIFDTQSGRVRVQKMRPTDQTESALADWLPPTNYPAHVRIA